jgi:hypothetical protein
MRKIEAYFPVVALASTNRMEKATVSCQSSPLTIMFLTGHGFGSAQGVHPKRQKFKDATYFLNQKEI